MTETTLIIKTVNIFTNNRAKEGNKRTHAKTRFSPIENEYMGNVEIQKNGNLAAQRYQEYFGGVVHLEHTFSPSLLRCIWLNIINKKI